MGAVVKQLLKIKIIYDLDHTVGEQGTYNYTEYGPEIAAADHGLKYHS